MSQGDGLRERLAEIIERQLGYTNGWSVPEEMYKDDCLKAADSILDLLSTSGEPVEPSAVVTCLVLGCYGIPQDGFKACAPHADRMRDKGMTVPVADSPPEPSTEGEPTPTGERPPLRSKELTRTLIDMQDSRMGLTEALEIVHEEFQKAMRSTPPPVAQGGEMFAEEIDTLEYVMRHSDCDYVRDNIPDVIFALKDTGEGERVEVFLSPAFLRELSEPFGTRVYSEDGNRDRYLYECEGYRHDVDARPIAYVPATLIIHPDPEPIPTEGET